MNSASRAIQLCSQLVRTAERQQETPRAISVQQSLTYTAVRRQKSYLQTDAPQEGQFEKCTLFALSKHRHNQKIQFTNLLAGGNCWTVYTGQSSQVTLSNNGEML